MIRGKTRYADVIVSFGESNSGGQAHNYDATAVELSPNNRLQILNVNTGVFEPLHIGVNNNLDHTGLDSSYHSWELGLSEMQRVGAGFGRTAYYIQLGHGGSQIGQWQPGGVYWGKAVSRVTQAQAWFLEKNIIPRYTIWATLGINDSIYTSPLQKDAYKSGMIDIFGRLRALLMQNAIISVTQLPETSGPMVNEYNAALSEIASTDSGVRVAQSYGLPRQDSYHYSYIGHKLLSKMMFDNSCQI